MVAKTNITEKTLVVGYRFDSELSNGTVVPPFRAATNQTYISLGMAISGPVWKYKRKGEWVIECSGCLESKSAKIEHSWLIKWAYKHRCTQRLDSP